MPAEFLGKMVDNATKLPFITEQRETELLTQAGFKKIRKIYQGTWFKGWLAVSQ